MVELFRLTFRLYYFFDNDKINFNATTERLVKKHDCIQIVSIYVKL